MTWNIRPERKGDEPAIYALTQRAFAPMPYSDGSEPDIINALRSAQDLSLSLVAVEDQNIIGQITFSPVTIDAQDAGYFGLGPVAVDPEHQGTGIGSALINQGLDAIKTKGARGCVLIGNPDYYGRFGFFSDPSLSYGDVPTEYVQQLPFSEKKTSGQLRYCDAFETAAGGT